MSREARGSCHYLLGLAVWMLSPAANPDATADGAGAGDPPPRVCRCEYFHSAIHFVRAWIFWIHGRRAHDRALFPSGSLVSSTGRRRIRAPAAGTLTFSAYGTPSMDRSDGEGALFISGRLGGEMSGTPGRLPRHRAILARNLWRPGLAWAVFPAVAVDIGQRRSAD